MALHNYFANANEPFPGGSLMLFERGATKKYERLHAATTFWVDGHVRIVEGCPGFEQLTKQMSKIGQYAVNEKVKIDWADAHSDAFMPQLYTQMRRPDPQPTSTVVRTIRIEGFGPESLEDEMWQNDNPRLPIR